MSRASITTRLVLLSLALLSAGVATHAAIETPQTLRVVVDNAYAPYSFESNDGKLQGILIDQWQAWERKTGVKVEMYAADWDDAVQRTRSGEFDVIDSIVETTDRQDYFDFTPAYATVEASIYFRKDISGITDLASLGESAVAVKTGDQHIAKLKASGVKNMIMFRNNDAIIEAAKKRTINVFVVDDPSALYLLHKMGIDADFRQSAPVFRDELRRAVRKGEVTTVRAVSHGFAAIEPDEFKRINDKWFGRTIDRYGLYFAYAGYAAAAAILAIAGLLGWNRSLRKGMLHAENQLGLVIDTIPTMAWSLRPEGSVDFVNQRWLEYTGLSRNAALQNSKGIVHPDDLPVAMEKWRDSMAAGKPAEDEMRLRRADGEYRWFLVRTVPLRNAQGHILKWYGTSTDIEDRKRSGDALRQSAAQLQALSRRLVDLQESERKQLARELHDRVGQSLTAIGINLAILRQADPNTSPRLEDSVALLKSTMHAIENVLSDLRPPMLDDHGLRAALDWHAKQFSARAGIAVSVRARGPELRMPAGVEIALFRIAQEALNNVAKHACATSIVITLECEGPEIVMSVVDDGIGVRAVEERPRSGLGIETMRERAQAVGGRFQIDSLPCGGTQLTVRIPNKRA